VSIPPMPAGEASSTADPPHQYNVCMRNVPLKTARRDISKSTEEIQCGGGITRNGDPVAGAEPLVTFTRIDRNSAERKAACKRMDELMNKGAHLGDLKFNRDEIYGP